MNNSKKNNRKEMNNASSRVSISWYPGHMAKTMKQLETDLKLVDVVVEILDARIPVSSQNPEAQKLIKNKKKSNILFDVAFFKLFFKLKLNQIIGKTT